jgi:hypothetical protein
VSAGLLCFFVEIGEGPKARGLQAKGEMGGIMGS